MSCEQERWAMLHEGKVSYPSQLRQGIITGLNADWNNVITTTI